MAHLDPQLSSRKLGWNLPFVSGIAMGKGKKKSFQKLGAPPRKEVCFPGVRRNTHALTSGDLGSTGLGIDERAEPEIRDLHGFSGSTWIPVGRFEEQPKKAMGFVFGIQILEILEPNFGDHAKEQCCAHPRKELLMQRMPSWARHLRWGAPEANQPHAA